MYLLLEYLFLIDLSVDYCMLLPFWKHSGQPMRAKNRGLAAITIDALERSEWECPYCGKKFLRRYLSSKEATDLFGYDCGLKIEVEGPDARNAHLATHNNKSGGKGTWPTRRRGNLRFTFQ